MGGVSSQGAAAAETLARLERLQRLCPPGWQVAGGRFVPVDTPAAYRVRGQQVTAGCRRHDCRRRVELDLADLVRSEHREHPIRFVIEQLKCGHWRGCGLELRPAIYPDGVPLISLVQHPNAIVEIGCCICPHVSRLSPVQVIEYLRRTKAGDGNTGVNVLATVIRGRCPRCRGSQFWARTSYG